MVASNERQPSRSPTPKFPLGQVVATPGAITALDGGGQNAHELLERHQSGDFGDVCREDWQANEQAVANGERILSSYSLHTGEKVWIITEADRSATTFLLPDEY